MEMKRMIVGLVLIATFALPALNATFEKDFITRQAINMVLKKANPNSNAMLDEQAIIALTGKILVSNPIIEEALLKHSNLNGLGRYPCGESCVYIPCITGIAGCSCSEKVCWHNSLAAN